MLSIQAEAMTKTLYPVTSAAPPPQRSSSSMQHHETSPQATTQVHSNNNRQQQDVRSSPTATSLNALQSLQPWAESASSEPGGNRSSPGYHHHHHWWKENLKKKFSYPLKKNQSDFQKRNSKFSSGCSQNCQLNQTRFFNKCPHIFRFSYNNIHTLLFFFNSFSVISWSFLFEFFPFVNKCQYVNIFFSFVCVCVLNDNFFGPAGDMFLNQQKSFPPWEEL